MDPIDELYEFCRRHCRKRFSKDPEVLAPSGNLTDALEFIYSQDWPVSQKIYYIGALMYAGGYYDAIESLHPLAKQVIDYLDSLDAQGIDVRALQLTAIPETERIRPEQMAKWPIIAEN